jgi:hypothetical protein
MATPIKSIKKSIKGKGDSGDWLQSYTPGAVKPDEYKTSKVRTAPVLDDEQRRLALLKEESKRTALGRRATSLRESNTLG